MAVTAQDRAGRSSAAALPTLLMVMLINMLGFGVVVPLLPFYAKSFHAPPWQIALLFSAYSVGSFFGEPFWGRLSDRIGRKPLLVSTVSANCVCYLALAFAPNVLVAFIVRLLGGLAAGNSSVVQGYIADVTPPEGRAGRLALLGAAYNMGFIFGPGLGGLLARTNEGPVGIQRPLLVAAGLAALSALGIFLVVRESRTHVQAALRGPNRWTMFGQALGHPVVGRVMWVTFLSGLAFTGIESTFGFWTQHRYGWTPREVGLCFTVAAVVSTLGQTVLTGPLSHRFGQAHVLAAGIVASVICLLAQPFAPFAWITVAILAAMSLSNSVAFPNSGALISRSINSDNQGQMLGLNNAMAAAARVAGPLVALSLFSVSPNMPFFTGAAITAPAMLLALSAGRAAGREGYPRRRRG